MISIRSLAPVLASTLALTIGTPAAHSATAPAPAQHQPVSYGQQYAITHVYVEPGSIPAFDHSWEATFGGTDFNNFDNVDVTPTPSNEAFSFVSSPVGDLSVFDFHTDAPYPFRQERTGWGVVDVDAAVKAAKRSGAYELVSPFNDVAGRDAIIQFPGGLNTQLWLNFTVPKLPKLTTVPENRVYITADTLRPFLSSYLRFTHGKVVEDKHTADAAEVGEAGKTMRRVSITSPFGKAVVFVTDGHLPTPYGQETTGYQVDNLDSTLAKATATGAKVLVEPHTANGRSSAVVKFPGGYVVEVHQNLS
ncbi:MULTISPECIES: VOC family protein [Streptomyces]|uniref:VOC family protein n=1 Tax=Streptomyces TaxID=1883 RepID=UPI0036AF76AF